jgi:sugar transferase (PEP-CTERM system associated)
MARVLNQRIPWRTAALIAGESALIVGAVCASASIRLGTDAWMLQQGYLGKALLVAVVCQLCLYYGDLYDLRIVGERRELFVRLLQSLGAAALLLGCAYALMPGLVMARGVFVLAAALVITVVTGWRVAIEWVSGVAPRERLLLVGTGPAAVVLARELYQRKELGVEIVGFVDPDRSKVGMPVINPGVIGTIDDIPSIIDSHAVDRVVVSLADARGKLPMDRLLDMKLSGVTFDHLASVYEEYTGKIAVENLRPSWFIFSAGFRKTRLIAATKRVLDIVSSVVGLTLALPVMAVVAVSVKCASRGPALYHQRRVGQHGREFTIHKFRTMRTDAEAKTGAVWASANDSRVFPLGRVLRKTRLDELPQLWNVLCGEMSLVGPRPERPEFVAQLAQQIPFYGQRHVVKPGVTGWAQVCYSYGASVEDAMEKLQYDLFYIKNQSLALDLAVILYTIKIVVRRRGAQ